MQLDLATFLEGQKKIREVTDVLKNSIDEINEKYELQAKEIFNFLDNSQKKHASEITEIAKIIDSIKAQNANLNKP